MCFVQCVLCSVLCICCQLDHERGCKNCCSVTVSHSMLYILDVVTREKMKYLGILCIIVCSTWSKYTNTGVHEYFQVRTEEPRP